MSQTDRWIRIGVLAVASLAFTNSSARAQNLAFTVAGETTGDNVHVLFSEVSIAEAGLGFRPVGSLGGYMVFHEGDNSWGINPAGGLRYSAPMGFTQVMVGYALRGENGTPLWGGLNSGLYTAIQSEFWGDGTYWAQGLANYNIGGNYLWSQGRLGRNLFRIGEGTAGLGAEITYQLETENPGPGVSGFKATQLGPVVRWNMGAAGPTFNFSGGWRETQFDREMNDTWYLKAELNLRNLP